MLSFTLRLLACCTATYVAWRSLGSSGIAWCAPLFGIALATPIFDGVTSSLAWLRALAYRDVEGRHYAFKGKSINVTEDEDGRMWLRLSDVRKVLPWLSSDEALRRDLGADLAQFLPDRAVRVEATGFATYLERAALADSIRFKVWIKRTVVFPSKRRKSRRTS